MTITDTLKHRGDKYGDFADIARLTGEFMLLVRNAESYGDMSDVHIEALHMIFSKIARMVNGDPWYSDNAHDIAGYATLLEDYINIINAKEIERKGGAI